MRKILSILFVLITLTYSSFADHYAGAELTYKCLGANGSDFDYEITLVAYRDCSGEILDDYYDIDYSSICITNAKLRLDAVTDLIEISPEKECSNVPTRCEDPQSLILGRQKRIYKSTITLPVCANDYIFSWRRQFRNALALTNIDASGGFVNQPIYVETIFNNSIENCNGSYSFEDNIMSRKICAGEYFSFDFKSQIINNGADSLYFELTQPLLDGFNNSVVYESGFTFSNPIQTQGGFTLNGNTGLLEFVSGSIAQSSIVAIKVYEFDDNGNLIGTTIRDMQIITENCNNNAPQILGINGTQEDTIYLCGGKQTCFEIPITDVDNDNIYLNGVSTQGIPGLGIGLISNGGANAYYRFCFNPDTTGVYNFELRVDDRHCPDTLEDVRTITIIVPNDTVFQCECANVSFDYDKICLGTSTEFNGVPTFSLGTSVDSWNWNFGDGSTSTSSNPTHQYTDPGSYDVTVEFTDDAGCIKSTTSTLTICDIPRTGFQRLDSCQTSATTPTYIRFEDTTYSECSILSRIWDYGDGISGGIASHSYQDSGWFNVQLILGYGDPNAPTICYDTTDQDMYVYPRPEFNIYPDDFLQSCDPTYDTLYTITLNDTSNEIQWYINGGLVPTELGGENDSLNVDTEDLTLSVSGARNIQIRVEIEDSLGCINDSIRTIFDPIKPRFLNTPYCEPGDNITFWDITDTTDNFSILEYGFLDREWIFNDPNDLLATSNAQTTQHYYSVEDIYTAALFMIDNDSCFDYASRPTINVVLPDSTFSVRASLDPDRDNDTICFSTQSVIFEGPNPDRATIDKYIWTFDDAGVDSVIISNNYNGTYSMTKFGVNQGVSTTIQIGDMFQHRYDSLDYGIKYVHLKMIYNTIRDDRNQLVDSLYCVRDYYDTLDLRPPHRISWDVDKNCWYEEIELEVSHLFGDTLTSWLVDWGDEGHGLDQVGVPYDTIYTTADTAFFDGLSFPDSIQTNYQYTDFLKPDFGNRDINLRIRDNFDCEVNYLLEDNYRIMKLDVQTLIPLNFCDNETIFFPPTSEVTETKRAWNDYWNNIGYLHWDFGVPGTDGDTVLLSMVDNFEDTVSFTFPDDTIYTITLTSIGNPAIGNNCISVITDQLAIQPAPIANLGIPGISCIGSPIEFVDNSINRGLWELDGNGQFVRVEDTLTNWVLYIDGDTINMSDDVTTVNGDTVDLGSFADGGFPYTYGSAYYDTVVLVAITDTGCFSTDTIITYTAPYPIANFGCEPNLPGPRSELVFIDSTDWIEDNIQHPDSAYRWTLTNDDGEIKLFEMGWDLEEVIYNIQQEDIFYMELIVMNEYRCSDTISKEIDSYSYLDFPTGFSPTSGGAVENNIFRLHHKGFKELLEYRIFNRYGEVVFVGETLDDVWDGKYKGRLQETGMYVVVVRAIDVLDREKQLKKNVLLVR